MRKFTVLWAGHLVSLVGSALTSFALGVWVYLETGSVTRLALIYMLAFLPGIVASPIAGALVDRWSRRTVLLGSDALGIGTTAVLALLYALGMLEPWHIYITTTVRSLVRALQIPAFGSSVILLVPKRQVGRANGMVLFAQALSQTAGPAVAGVLLVSIGLSGVILIDCVTFLANVVVLLTMRIPRPATSAEGSVGKGTLLGESRHGWNYLMARRGLLALILFYAALNLSVGFVDVLVTPIVVGFASAAVLGVVLSIGGSGMVLGSLTMAAWGGPRRRIHGVVGFSFPLGLALCLGALRPSAVLVAVAAFCFLFCSAIIDGSTRSIFQVKVEPDMQGRVFALHNMIGSSTLALSYLLAGPIADHVFEPLLQPGGRLAGSVGQVIGVGDGRGMALLLLVLGVVVVLTALAGYAFRTLRDLDRALPDAVDDTPGAAAAAPAEPVPAPDGTPPAPTTRPAAPDRDPVALVAGEDGAGQQHLGE